MNKLFPQLRERILYLTELLWEYPPFCYNDYEKELRRINILFDESALPQIRTPDSEFQTEFLRFCVGIIRIPIAMYAAQNSLSLSVSPTRYRQLRTVAYLCAMADNASDETILSAVSTALEVTPSVAAALRKLKRDLYGGAYGRWLSAQKAIRTAKAEAEQAAGQDTTPQRTWWEEWKLPEHFLCEVTGLARIHEIFSDAAYVL